MSKVFNQRFDRMRCNYVVHTCLITWYQCAFVTYLKRGVHCRLWWALMNYVPFFLTSRNTSKSVDTPDRKHCRIRDVWQVFGSYYLLHTCPMKHQVPFSKYLPTKGWWNIQKQVWEKNERKCWQIQISKRLPNLVNNLCQISVDKSFKAAPRADCTNLVEQLEH